MKKIGTGKYFPKIFVNFRFRLENYIYICRTNIKTTRLLILWNENAQ